MNLVLLGLHMFVNLSIRLEIDELRFRFSVVLSFLKGSPHFLRKSKHRAVDIMGFSHTVSLFYQSRL